jgi:hypothetical protein
MQRTRRARLRSSQAIARTEAVAARADTRDWAAARRARTRQLIELGGLVHKAGLVELMDDDRATLLGALLELAGRLREGEAYGDVEAASSDHLSARWRHAGLRAFHAEREAAEAGQAPVRGPELETEPA